MSGEGPSSPFLAGDDPDLLALSVRRDEPRLPPLVIRSVYDVEDVSVREAQALAGQAAVPRPIVIKQSSDHQTGGENNTQRSHPQPSAGAGTSASSRRVKLTQHPLSLGAVISGIWSDQHSRVQKLLGPALQV